MPRRGGDGQWRPRQSDAFPRLAAQPRFGIDDGYAGQIRGASESDIPKAKTG